MSKTVFAIPLKYQPTAHPKLSDIKAMPSPRYKSHWALIASDRSKSDAFYEALTGSDFIVAPVPSATTWSWDEEHHRLFIGDRTGMLTMIGAAAAAAMPAPLPGARAGEAGGGIRFASPAALVKLVDRMEQIGHQPERIVDRDELISVLFHDPDNLIVDTFAPVADGTQEGTKRELTLSEFRKRFG